MNTITMHEAAKAWAEGKDVEWMSWHDSNGLWKPLSREGFCFNTHIQFRIKPEITTSFTNEELWVIYYKALGSDDEAARGGAAFLKNDNNMRKVADAAIKQYIKDTQK